MNIFKRIFGRPANAKKIPQANPRLEQFREQAKAEGFSVDFDPRVGRIVLYQDRGGNFTFSFDLGSKGDHSLALEWPRSAQDWVVPSREKTAFERAKHFLEACGFEVELWPPELERGAPISRESFVNRVREAAEKAGCAVEEVNGKIVLRCRDAKK